MCAYHVTVFGVLAQVTVVHPIGVLHGQTIFAPLPVLGGNLTSRVVNLVCAHFVPVVTAGEEIGTHNGVHVRTLINHVTVHLVDVACVQIQCHLVVEKLRCVTIGEVVAVVALIGYNTFRIGSCHRSVGLVAFGTRRESNRIGGNKTSLQVVISHIVTVVVVRCEAGTPAVR